LITNVGSHRFNHILHFKVGHPCAGNDLQTILGADNIAGDRSVESLSSEWLPVTPRL
jgi:hypothetical protein